MINIPSGADPVKKLNTNGKTKKYVKIRVILYICMLIYFIYIFMIKISDLAKNKVIELMSNDGFIPEQDFIRVGVKSGGCSGLSYDLKFDKNKNEDDKMFEDKNIKIVVDKKSFLYLIGTTLEYSGGLNGTGFVFSNPNANRTCGCGESFSL